MADTSLLAMFDPLRVALPDSLPGTPRKHASSSPDRDTRAPLTLSTFFNRLARQHDDKRPSRSRPKRFNPYQPLIQFDQTMQAEHDGDDDAGDAENVDLLEADLISHRSPLRQHAPEDISHKRAASKLSNSTTSVESLVLPDIALTQSSLLAVPQPPQLRAYRPRRSSPDLSTILRPQLDDVSFDIMRGDASYIDRLADAQDADVPDVPARLRRNRPSHLVVDGGFGLPMNLGEEFGVVAKSPRGIPRTDSQDTITRTPTQIDSRKTKANGNAGGWGLGTSPLASAGASPANRTPAGTLRNVLDRMKTLDEATVRKSKPATPTIRTPTTRSDGKSEGRRTFGNSSPQAERPRNVDPANTSPLATLSKRSESARNLNSPARTTAFSSSPSMTSLRVKERASPVVAPTGALSSYPAASLARNARASSSAVVRAKSLARRVPIAAPAVDAEPPGRKAEPMFKAPLPAAGMGVSRMPAPSKLALPTLRARAIPPRIAPVASATNLAAKTRGDGLQRAPSSGAGAARPRSQLPTPTGSVPSLASLTSPPAPRPRFGATRMPATRPLASLDTPKSAKDVGRALRTHTREL